MHSLSCLYVFILAAPTHHSLPPICGAGPSSPSLPGRQCPPLTSCALPCWPLPRPSNLLQTFPGPPTESPSEHCPLPCSLTLGAFGTCRGGERAVSVGEEFRGGRQGPEDNPLFSKNAARRTDGWGVGHQYLLLPHCRGLIALICGELCLPEISLGPQWMVTIWLKGPLVLE